MVYHPVGWKGKGLGESSGFVASGSPAMFRVMRNLSGRSARIGRVLSATGLYLRFAAKVATCGSWVSGSSTGTRIVLGNIADVENVSIEGEWYVKVDRAGDAKCMVQAASSL